MTNEQHNRYIAYTFFGHAAFQLLMLFVMAAFFSMIFFIPIEPGKPGPPKEFFAMMIGFFSIFYLFFTVPSVIAGYALLTRKSWARLASIIAGVVAAMNVPIGTAACIYSLWFFLGDNWKAIYAEKADTLREEYPQISYGAESQQAAYEAEQRLRETFRTREPSDWR